MKKILCAYDMLVDRNIIFHANNTEYSLIFKYENLKHLLGLQHIKDNDFLKNIKSTDIPKI